MYLGPELHIGNGNCTFGMGIAVDLHPQLCRKSLMHPSRGWRWGMYRAPPVVAVDVLLVNTWCRNVAL